MYIFAGEDFRGDITNGLVIAEDASCSTGDVAVVVCWRSDGGSSWQRAKFVHGSTHHMGRRRGGYREFGFCVVVGFGEVAGIMRRLEHICWCIVR